MSRLTSLKTVFQYCLIVYLVSHGVTLWANSQVEPRELALVLYYGSVSWLREGISWVHTVVEFLRETSLIGRLRTNREEFPRHNDKASQ